MPSRADTVPAAAALRDLERRENVPVALRILPRAVRVHLRAVYDVARLVDDIGDAPGDAAADRLAALDAAEVDLRRVWTADVPRNPVFRGLVPTARECALAPEPFLDLVEANRLDQRVTRFPAYADLLDYCALSANPVGRIVLGVFGVHDARAITESDKVCTALQILEHCQDVAEDKRDRDRIYLPLEDLAAFSVTEHDLDQPAASAAVRRLVGFEVDRAATLLDDGSALVSRLHGWARVAVAGYVAGGRATVDALRRADGDVLSLTPRPRRRDVGRHALRLVVGRG